MLSTFLPLCCISTICTCRIIWIDLVVEQGRGHFVVLQHYVHAKLFNIDLVVEQGWGCKGFQNTQTIWWELFISHSEEGVCQLHNYMIRWCTFWGGLTSMSKMDAVQLMSQFRMFWNLAGKYIWRWVFVPEWGWRRQRGCWRLIGCCFWGREGDCWQIIKWQMMGMKIANKMYKRHWSEWCIWWKSEEPFLTKKRIIRVKA